MFDFLFGAKRRRKSCRKPKPRRRYKSSNASCNGRLKRDCKKPGCTYASGEKFYGCRAARGFANIVLSMSGIPPQIAPVVAQQIKQVADAAAQTAVEQGADPVAAAGAAAADMVAAEGAALGLSPQQTAEVAVQAAGQAAQEVATQQGATPAEANVAAQEVAQVAAAAGPPIQNPLIAEAAKMADNEPDSARPPVLNPLVFEPTKKLSVSEKLAQGYYSKKNKSQREAASGPTAPSTPPPSTPPPPSSERRLDDALNSISAFGYRRGSRFGSTECTAYNNMERECLTQMEGNRYKCIYKSGGSCALRPNRSFKTRDQLLEATGAANYAWYVNYFGARNIGGLANTYIPPPPPPVMGSYYSPARTPEPYIFGSAQMTGPGPGRTADEVRDYCKRFNVNDCRQQLNCQVWGDTCRARQGAGAAGYESRGIPANSRWRGPINRPGYVRSNTPYVPPRPVRPPPPPPGAPPPPPRTPPPPPRTPPAKSLYDLDSDGETSFGYRRRKSRPVSLNAIKAKCRRLGIRLTTGKSRKPKTMAQLKRQCALKSPTRRAAPRRKRTTRAAPRRRCPAGSRRVGGSCRRITPSASSATRSYPSMPWRLPRYSDSATMTEFGRRRFGFGADDESDALREQQERQAEWQRELDERERVRIENERAAQERQRIENERLQREAEERARIERERVQREAEDRARIERERVAELERVRAAALQKQKSPTKVVTKSPPRKGGSPIRYGFRFGGNPILNSREMARFQRDVDNLRGLSREQIMDREYHRKMNLLGPPITPSTPRPLTPADLKHKAKMKADGEAIRAKIRAKMAGSPFYRGPTSFGNYMY
jgi:hypothetical protein